MKRIIEPSELMIIDRQCEEYADAERTRMRDFFIHRLVNTIGILGRVADLGCGPGDYDMCISKIFPTVTIDAYDGSEAMILLAKETTKGSTNINLLHQQIESISKKYDVVISANTLHHFTDPNIFWKSIKTISTGKTNVFIMDLLRPNTLIELNEIVESSSITLSKLFKKDFVDSLHAAFTEEEIKKQLLDNNLNLSTTVYNGELNLITIHGIV